MAKSSNLGVNGARLGFAMKAKSQAQNTAHCWDSPLIGSMSPVSAHSHRTLLIVDDDRSVCRALTRLLGRSFDEVLSAGSSGDAASILQKSRVTHLICDYCLGRDEPLGVELVPGWRADHPSIQCAVIFTGNDIGSIRIPIGVDAVLPKSAEPSDLMAIFERSSHKS